MPLKESKNEEGKGNNVIMYNCPEPNIKNKDEMIKIKIRILELEFFLHEYSSTNL